MTAHIINGYDLAKQIRADLKNEVNILKNNGLIPKLTVILVGNDPASQSYVNGKKKASNEIGIESEIIKKPASISENELLQLIGDLNDDSTVHGILVQLPLPDHIEEQRVIESIHPSKDVDGFHPINIGKMMTGQDTLLPCTPYGIMEMLHFHNIKPAGKHAVVIGRSNIVGKPIGQLLLQQNATVTYCHSHTKNLQAITQLADIIVVATGRAHMINAQHIKEGAVVIDVGINRLPDGTLTGDVDFESAKTKASYITPVPRGVGPMTIAMLLKNTVKAAQRFDVT